MMDYSKQEVTLIDFGLCNKFKTQYDQHIPFKNTNKILGTPLYASNNALLGKGKSGYSILIESDYDHRD
jgi:serine/threonine protein kinase